MSTAGVVEGSKPLLFWSSPEQLCPEMFLMAYSQEWLVFSCTDRWETIHLQIQWGGKKSLLSLVERQWPSRSSQYKRKTWSLVKRIKLPHPSEAKRESHKSVKSPRRPRTDPTIHLGTSERSECGSLRRAPITASSHTWSGAWQLPNPVRPTRRWFNKSDPKKNKRAKLF